MLYALEDAITPNTVAFLVEPIQGEAGIIVPPDDYFSKVREICNKHGIILITDEIQTGLGRTGKILAEEHYGIQADVTLIGKALSGAALSDFSRAFKQRCVRGLSSWRSRQHLRRQSSCMCGGGLP